MKYLAIDIETTGLDETTCQILEVGAVVADTLDDTVPLEELPYLELRLYHDPVVGEPYALRMNAQLIADMVQGDSRGSRYVKPEQAVGELLEFIDKYLGHGNKIVVAGKNFATFDLRFLRRLPGWELVKTHRRVLDPAILFLLPDDAVPPDTRECTKRAALSWDEARLHSAVWDCRLVVALLRKGLR